MKLIGMLNSPYVRRVAIALQLLQIDFEHEPVSVFRETDRFAAYNPLLKAPTLVTPHGTLMDSSLILAYLQARSGRSLHPSDLPAFARCLRRTGLALTACDKAVQLVYEASFRPAAMRSVELTARFKGQLGSALGLIDQELDHGELDWTLDGADIGRLTCAVAWTFVVQSLPDLAAAFDVPALAHLARSAEESAPFQRAPFGTGRVIAAA